MFNNNRRGPVEVDENGRPIHREPQFDFSKMKRKLELPKFSFKGLIGVVVLVLLVVVISSSAFTVNEMEQALVVRFGSVDTVYVAQDAAGIAAQLKASNKFEGIKVVEGKGLRFKMPFIDQVEKYNSRLLTYKTTAGEVTALDKKKIVLDNNAQWRIVNPALFRISMGNQRSANARLDDLIFAKLREQIGKTKGTTLVSDKDYVYEMTKKVRDEINEEVKEYGMEVYDVRIAKTEFPEQNSANIFNRMRTERQKMANKLRAEGDEQYQIITAKAEKEATIIKAEAYAEAEKIKGEGDAEALEIYAQAYNKDPEFYQFIKTLDTYKKALGKQTKIVIDSDSEFAKYLFNIQAMPLGGQQ
ncbi:MAG: HflC protein [Clostridiales bacterium]|nr:MAG: HflC protein [Clostridiales bacterium]